MLEETDRETKTNTNVCRAFEDINHVLLLLTGILLFSSDCALQLKQLHPAFLPLTDLVL